MLGPPRLGARLVVLAFARNECPSYNEWLQHGRAQGVRHFYIIDHNSTDDCDVLALSVGGDVTVWSWHQPLTRNFSTQEVAYNAYLPMVRAAEVARGASGTWLGLWDLDEVIFGVNHTLAHHLHTLPPSVDQLCLNWLTFGSSGHMKQPRCLAASNLYRKLLPADPVGKCIQRLDAVHKYVVVVLSVFPRHGARELSAPTLFMCAHISLSLSPSCTPA